MAITVSCPTCQQSVEWNDNARSRPFCSERCKLIDLGEWANEEKAIPGQPAPIPDQTPGNDDQY